MLTAALKLAQAQHSTGTLRGGLGLRLRRLQRGLGERKLATGLGKAGNGHVHRACQFKVPLAVKARGQGARQCEVIHPGDRGGAADAAAALTGPIQASGVVLAQPQLATAVAQAHTGTMGLQRQVDAIGIDAPSAFTLRRGFQGDVKLARQAGRPESHAAIDRQFKHLAALRKRHVLVRRNRHRGLAAVVCPVPVNDRASAAQNQLACHQLTVEQQLCRAQVGQGIALHRGTAHQGLGADPLPRCAGVAFGGEHHRHVQVAQAGTQGAVAQCRLNTGTAKDQLVDRHRAAVAEQDGGRIGVAACFDEHVARDAQHTGHLDRHVPSDSGFVVCQGHQDIARTGGDHLVFQCPPQTVVSNAQRIGLQRDAIDPCELQTAAHLQCVARSGDTTGGDFFDVKRTHAFLQDGAHTPGCEVAMEVTQTHAQSAGGHATALHRLRLNTEVARDAAKPIQGEGALLHLQRLHSQTVGEVHGQTLAAHTDGLCNRLAQRVDAHRSAGVQTQACEAIDTGRSTGHQGIACLTQGIGTGIQAELAAADGHATQVGLQAIQTDQQRNGIAAALLTHCKVARQAAKAVHIHSDIFASQAQAIGIEAGTELTRQAKACQTTDGRGATDRAAALTAIQEQVAAAALQGHARATSGQGHVHIAGLDAPDALLGGGITVEHDVEIARQARGAKVHRPADRDLPTPVGHVQHGLLACIHGRQRDAQGLVAAPVEHRTCGVFDQMARCVHGLVQAQLGAVQVGQRLPHDVDAAQLAQGRQPALAGVGRVL